MKSNIIIAQTVYGINKIPGEISSRYSLRLR